MTALLRWLRSLPLPAWLAGMLDAWQAGGGTPAPTGSQARGIAAEEKYGPPLAGGGGVAPAIPEAPAGAGQAVMVGQEFWDFAFAETVLRRVMPNLPQERMDLYTPFLTAAMAEFQVNTKLRASAFLAQLAHESAELTRWEENLNYSAAALLATFPRHFDAETVAAYARQPERIANRVYANRMGNGPEESGDGWRYRGRGPIELTGADGYRGIGAALGVDLVGNPDLAATPKVGFRIAGRYWNVNGCNKLADAGNFTAITRAINGGLNGLASRERYYRVAKEALGVA